MKIALIIVVVLHGLIHLLGFVKAFSFAEVQQLSRYISRPLGIIWLITAILFLLVAVLIIMNKSGWPFFAIAAVILSQTLIFIFWSDAKFGTILNVVVLIAAVQALGSYQFDKLVNKEVREFGLINSVPASNPVTEEEIAHLPEPVQRWLRKSGVVGRPVIIAARLEQKGQMKTKPEGRWMSFNAQQTVNLKDPAFIWKARVKAAPGIYMDGRDKFKNGEGEMLIKLQSLLKVVNEGNEHKINSGTMLRFLGEICWFPSAALNSNISWEEINASRAKAILKMGEETVSGIFTFSNEGDLLSFEAQRYYGGGKDSTLQPWHITVTSHKTFSGYRIPNNCTVTWKLPEGDFPWLNLEITAVEYFPNGTTISQVMQEPRIKSQD